MQVHELHVISVRLLVDTLYVVYMTQSCRITAKLLSDLISYSSHKKKNSTTIIHAN